jgi:hypothetical protein
MTGMRGAILHGSACVKEHARESTIPAPPKQSESGPTEPGGIMEDPEASTTTGISFPAAPGKSLRSGQKCPTTDWWIPDGEEHNSEYYKAGQTMRYGPHGEIIIWTGPLEQAPGSNAH